ncbi:MAG: hypothetical protein ACTHJP_10095 [Rhodanobacteraceae bacterium]
MSDTPLPPDESPTGVAKPGIRWDALAAIIASLVGLLALLVAGYTAYIQRQQVRAQVWPYLIGGNSGSESSLIWMNKGVGPAIVRNLEVTVAGKSQRDWRSVEQSLGIPSLPYGQSTLNGYVMSPGETIGWIKFNDKSDYHAFISAARRLDMKAVACYCSTLGECWTTELWQFARTRIDKCPALPQSKQFQD